MNHKNQKQMKELKIGDKFRFNGFLTIVLNKTEETLHFFANGGKMRIVWASNCDWDKYVYTR